ncbi:unnamed protein product, partial [Gulo gulo]
MCVHIRDLTRPQDPKKVRLRGAPAPAPCFLDRGWRQSSQVGHGTAPPHAGLGQPSWFARRPPATRNESKPLKEQSPTHRVFGTS